MNPIDTLIQAWNEPNPEQRQKLLEHCTTTDLRYIDPHVQNTLVGQAAMLEFLNTFRSRLAHQLEVEGEPDTHHHVFRFNWLLRHPQDNSILSKGEFIGELAADRIQNIIGFLNKSAL
jgi:hypothetical protein